MRRIVAVVGGCWLFGMACGHPASPAAPVRAQGRSLALRAACGDREADVYRAVAATGTRGQLLACARAPALTAAEVTLRAGQKGYDGPALTSGATVLRVAYQTERLAHQPGASTAVVYLPTVPRAWPVPAVVVAHGTIGLADACAPSRMNGAGTDEMVMPLVGLGYAVIATDYAGLGNGHGQTYQGWHLAPDEAHSVLDAARALTALLAPGQLTRGVVLMGHSQGGGAVLAAQAAARGDGTGVEVAGVVAFAPGWFDARVFGTLLTHRELRTHGRLELLHAFVAMWFFSHAAVYDGVQQAALPFAPALREGVRHAMDERCILTLGRALAALAPTVGQLYDPSYVSSIEACLGGGPCDEPGKTWLARALADRPRLDPAGAPVLVLQGLLDGIVSPTATACTLQELADAGVKARACTDPGADHISVLARTADLARQFIDSRLGSAPAPTCESRLPACVPPSISPAP